MASFNDNGRGDDSKRRPAESRRRRQSRLELEALEQRRMLTGGPTWHPTSSNVLDAFNGPLANLGKDTVKAYSDFLNYQAGGSHGQFTTSLYPAIKFNNTSIGLDVRGYGDFNTFKGSLTSLGFQITASVPKYDLIEGYFPLAKLPQLASQAQIVGGSPIYTPKANQQGSSPNESDLAINAPAAKLKFNVDGTGQKVAVLSNSISQFGTGLAGSVASGDLPSDVQVIQDGNPGDDDEGRGMLEQIYDIAPGAKLAFATAFSGEAGFATNITALANAGSSVIVDDVSYFAEPYYQDGIVQQSINSYVASGGVYLSSAGNSEDSGYQSNFRGVNATVGSLGAGRYQNFDPTGATTTTQLGIVVRNSGSNIFMQFDQPFYTANGVVSNVEIDILDQSGNIVAQGNQNNVATQIPFQAVGPLNAGTYTVVIKVLSGPDPGHVVFYSPNDVSVDQKFGTAGGTFYPTSTGHNSGDQTISVGAVPFWAAPNYVHTPPISTSEPFSSFGPRIIVFGPDGTPLASPRTLLKPDISAPDGNNTSFFLPPPAFIDTSQPFSPANTPYPGNPVNTFPTPTTPTNQSNVNFPNFFGTSSAAPNLAAVVALMRQSNPSLTRAQILNNLITTATPLNNIPKGVWSPQAGYGLADALAALSAVQTLKVTFISPGASQTITATPGFIQVTFNQPVKLSSVKSSNLVVTGPNGATVAVGNPVGVDDPTNPSIVRFPITITPFGTNSANGVYNVRLIATGITSVTGQPLVSGVTDRFNLQQVQGPKITTTSYVGRIVNIQFNEALNPATVTPNNVILFRNGGVNAPTFGPGTIFVSSLPGATISYNPSSFTVTVDLTNVAQSSLPTDHYGLIVSTNLRDSLNNPLNGAFNGVFPSGTNPPIAGGSNFFQDLGVVTLQPPLVTYEVLAPATDSGIKNDNNTNISRPSVVGQVTAKFPGTLSGLLVYAEFNGIAHAGVATGGLDLGLGQNGRGFVGHFDVQTTTNALGQFTINYPAGVSPLPDGLNRVRVVVVGAPDLPPFAGLSTVQDSAFRIDTTSPYVGSLPGGGPATSIPQGANINSLTALTLNVIDPVIPQAIGSPFAVDPKFSVPALNPTVVANVQNYRLFRVVGTTLVDSSSFITSATFVSTSTRVLSSDPYTGQINLTFGPGLPTGVYRFLALSSAYGQGLSDAAGNAFAGYPGTPSAGTSFNYELDFNLQPTPTFITNYTAYTPDGNGTKTTGVRANYELPISGITPRAVAPPNEFTIDFSNPLNASTDYSAVVQLVRSADTANALPDGNFGDLGITNTSSGYQRIAGITVTLVNSVPGAVFGQYGYHNRLDIKLPAGLTLPADYYRVYLPNSGQTPVTDIFGNQLDGEFLGYQNASGKYVDQLQTGVVRGAGAGELPDLSGDGTPGGAFMTGFVVVPNGNIIYAQADAIYNPQLPSQTPNGSLARPYPVLAPEAVPTGANGGDLNSVVNSGTNFNPTYDRNGDGRFEPSAFFAAQQRVQANGGPVVILANASVPSRDPLTGLTVQKPFILTAPSPSGNQAATIANDASAAVPALTVLTFNPGTILKMQNAALLIQNQGSALQVLGGPNSYQSVVITSYKDSSVGGVSNGDPTSVPTPGDYGGIVFRNFSQAGVAGSAPRSQIFPGQVAITGNPLTDGRLKGQFTNSNNPSSQLDAISGSDDIQSSLQFLTEKYAGGAVPITVGVRYDGITLINSRPAVVNTIISNAGGAGSAQAGLSVNVDSLRADDVAQGPLIRNDQFINNGLNGIYVRAEVATGVAQPTNAIIYPSAGGPSNSYVFNNPYPYLLTSKLQIGQALAVESGGILNNTTDRLYVNPGMLVKFEQGAWFEIGTQPDFGGQGAEASLVVGDRTYIKEYDVNNLVGPTIAPGLPGAGQVDPSFRPNSALLAKVLFTSFNDDTASTSYFDPITQVTTPIVRALPALTTLGVAVPPAKGDWGGIQLDAGSHDTINSAVFRYGGGPVNTPLGSSFKHAIEINPKDAPGAFVSITNNQFVSNADVPINMAPNALLATDVTRPLASGAPFIHGNLFTGNDYNAVGVQGGTTGFNSSNVDFDSVWSAGDFTYLLRDTIVLGPTRGGILTLPGNIANVLLPEPTPNVTLTLQSTLAGTLLADGTSVAAPGLPLVIKLQNTPGLLPPPSSGTSSPGPLFTSSFQQGAGFIVGVDNGIDPPADRYIDPGAFSQLRIVGIGANQTTGQSRVPVVITSIHDNTVGTSVGSVQMNQVIPSDTQAPARGDGGVIYFGANSLTDYNLLDPRDGNIIDNADIRYLTRIEQQGGGLIYGYDTTGAGTTFTPSYNLLLGLPLPGTLNYSAQYNQAKQLTLSNSNFASFSDVGFVAHPGFGSLVINGNFPYTGAAAIENASRVTTFLGEPTHTFFVNNTFTNMTTGVRIISENAADVSPTNGPYPTPAMAVFLNNTFDVNGTAIDTQAPDPTGTNFYSHVALLAMDNIFSNNTVAVNTTGQNYGGIQNDNQNNVFTIRGGQLQYNLFSGNGTNVTFSTVRPDNNFAFTGSPAYRDPATGNYFLQNSSAAIDRARSEIGPTIFGDMLYPAVNFQRDANGQIDPSKPSVRNEPVFLGAGGFGNLDQNQPAGSVNEAGGLGYFSGGPSGVPYYVDIVTLPGEPVSERGFPDQWIPVLQTSGRGTGGPASNAGTNFYQPIVGERDQAGTLRVKDPFSGNIGFGSRPYFDLGAFEYIIQNPPVVEAVTATNSVSTSSIYGVGVVAGTNKLPTSIQFQFNERLDPLTISGSSVILLASGGDGIFGNGNSPNDRAISVSGKLTFNPANNVLTIDTSGIFTSTATANDEYRIILKGTGSSVIRDTDGLALDGLNLDANGNQVALPSGRDNFPGSDFVVTFTIDTNPPSVVSGTFKLDPASDTSNGRNITKNNLPTFTGTITDIFPPTNFLQGQSVHIDVSTKGDGVFDLLDAGVGVTDASGNFRVTLTKKLPDTPNTIGAGGIQGNTGSTITLVRVRVIDQAGNASNTTTDPISSFGNKGALTGLQVDTVRPIEVAFAPAASSVATVSATGVTITVVFSENIRTSTLNANSVLVQRTGGTGSFNAPVTVPIASNSLTTTYSTDPATFGFEVVTFRIAAPLANDQYRVILKGTGTTPVTDIAGNALDGLRNGSGSDFTSGPFVVYSPTRAHLIYVQDPTQVTTPGTGVQGTRTNPFPTITAAIKAAQIGDDVLVLPGTYQESVVLKAGIRLLSAALSSTNTSFTAGSPYQTLLYGVPSTTSTTATNIITIQVSGSTPGIPTEVSGFAIISPLTGDPNFGTITSSNVGIQAVNSDVTIDRNIVINAGIGLNLGTSGANAPTSQVFDNLIAGNLTGIRLTDNGSTTSTVSPYLVVNNTIVDNTTGLSNTSTRANTLQAYVINNIFYSNHDLTTQRNGTGIQSTGANTLGVGNNLFYQNGKTNAAASNASGSFGPFNPAALTTTPDALGNLIGNPDFALPEDPRPNGNSPAVFLNYSNFDLTSRSVAINAGNNAVAPASDFLYRTPVTIAGHGFPGTGPASIGAFYFGGKSGPSGGTGVIFTGSTTTGTSTGTGTGTGSGTGRTNATTPAGGVSTVSAMSIAGSGIDSTVGGGIALGTRQFNVVSTSLSSNGSAHASDGLVGLASLDGPAYIDINFSNDIDSASLSPTDLVLSGGGLNPANPAKASSLAWIDDHAVRFYLSGGYNPSGTVSLSLPTGAITDTKGASLVGFTDSFQVAPTAPAPSAVPVTLPSSTTAPAVLASALPVVQPLAAAPPTKAVHKLTPKELKQQAAELKAHKAAEAKAAKVAAKQAARQLAAAKKASKSA